MTQSFDKRQQRQIFINRTYNLVWLLSSANVNTFSTMGSHVTTRYSPSLDNFHIYQSKDWGMDADKVGSYCIFSYTNMFQDPRSKAYIQNVHSEAVSFWHVSCNLRIPHDTASYTCDLPCSPYSFWYKAWHTGTANKPFFLYIILKVLFYMTPNISHFLPSVGSQNRVSSVCKINELTGSSKQQLSDKISNILPSASRVKQSLVKCKYTQHITNKYLLLDDQGHPFYGISLYNCGHTAGGLHKDTNS